MIVRVYHMKTGPGVYKLGNREIPISTQYHLFIPSYELYFNGHRFLLPGYIDTETGEFTADFKGVDLDKPTGDWIEYPYEGIPKNSTEIEVDDSFVERIIQAREDSKREMERFGEELKRSNRKLGWKEFGGGIKYRTCPVVGVNPFEYWDKLSEAIEDLFHKYVDSVEAKELKTPQSSLPDYTKFLLLVTH